MIFGSRYQNSLGAMKERRTNFFMVDNRIFEYDLKLRDIAVYCFLCRRLNRENNVAFPSLWYQEGRNGGQGIEGACGERLD